MIQTITHKGLRLFFEKGNGSKLPADYLSKIAFRYHKGDIFDVDYVDYH